MLADGLADDLAPGVEDPSDDRCVDVGHESFEQRGSIHHRHARHGDVVLDSNGLSGQLARAGAFDGATPVPGVQWILFRRGPVSPGTRVVDRQLRLGELIEAVVRGEQASDQVAIVGELLVREFEAEARGRLVEDGVAGRLDWHIGLLNSCVGPDEAPGLHPGPASTPTSRGAQDGPLDEEEITLSKQRRIAHSRRSRSWTSWLPPCPGGTLGARSARSRSRPRHAHPQRTHTRPAARARHRVRSGGGGPARAGPPPVTLVSPRAPRRSRAAS